ncbi:MAG: hypothetical protein HYX80_02505 [Chloroflexi bacterium]|nr:hypothetical protein [Chloroflexota bacterium]
MTLVLDKEKAVISRRRMKEMPVLQMEEAVALCPKCKAFQTIFLVGDRLVETRKFSQRDGQVYHDCGAEEPCRLYRTLKH